MATSESIGIRQLFDQREIQGLAGFFTIIAAFLFLRRFKENGVKDDGKRYPPSLPLLPVVGAIFRGGMSVLPEHFMRSAEKLGPVFSFTLGKRRVVVLNGYEAIFDAMVKHSEAFAERVSLFTEEKILNPELRGIASACYAEAYKKYHKLSLSILKEFGFGVQSVSETQILQEVESMKDEILKLNERPFDPKWPFTFATSNVIINSLYGRTFQHSLPKDHSAMIKNARECLEHIDLTLNMAPVARFLPMFWNKIDALQKHGKIFLNAIEVAIEFVKSNNSEPTFVGRFLEIEGTEYNHQDLLYVLRDLSLASTAAVSTTLQWAMVELANHPEAQDRLQKEIDEMVPGDRLPSLDDKPRLPYTEAVILEILRRSIGPFLIPHGTLKDTQVLEYDVPKGCMIIANAYSSHMDPKFWKDPENFRPDRFLDKDNKIIHSRRVIAFGLGRRSCLGEAIARQSVFLFLTSLVQRFDIRPPDGQDSIIVKEITAIARAPAHVEVRLIPRVKPTQG